MTSLVMTYVYFDKIGDIKAITPANDDALSSEFSYVLLPLSEVEGFLTGQKNTFDYLIKQAYNTDGKSKLALAKKYAVADVTRSLDNYLTKVSEGELNNSVIQIISDPVTCKITLLLNKDYRELRDTGTIEERESVLDFSEQGLSTIYFTKKNNPYSLLYTLSFIPSMLLNEIRLSFDYPKHVDLRNSSVYTKRLVDSYVYAIRKDRNVI